MDSQVARVRLRGMLATLTSRQRQILSLRVLDGLSAEETAARLGMSAADVRVVQHQALNRLRRETKGMATPRSGGPAAGSGR